MATDSAAYLTNLHRLLLEFFNLEEIRTLCLYLHVDHETVPGAEKSAIIRELLLALGRNGRLPALITMVKEQRPLVDWPQVPDDFQIPEALIAESAGTPTPIHYYYGNVVQGDVIQGDKVLGTKIQAQTYIAKQVILSGDEMTDLEKLLPEAGQSPYKGLTYFREEDADWFFGRERITAVVVNRLHEVNFLAVVGASGSGKSSIARAGIVPALKRTKPLPDGSVPPFGMWQVKVMTPTARPLNRLVDTLFPDDSATQKRVYDGLTTKAVALRDALADQLTPERPLLLVVDQFEELFSLCQEERQREAFVANLIMAAQPVCKIILTLRADYYDHCLRYEPLRNVLREGQEPLGPLNREELRAAILKPAAKGGWQVQAGLADELLEDVGQEPGALPLLSHALRETWEQRRGRVLTLSGYRAVGGVRGAIAQTAERVYNDFQSDEQAIARRIFLELSELNEQLPEKDTRRQLELRHLRDFGEDALAARVVQQLTEARLLTMGDTQIEVAHEALIREWPRLRTWLDEDRVRLRIHRLLSSAAQEWANHNQDKNYLYQGARLQQATTWVADDPGKSEALGALEQSFLRASIRRDRLLRWQRIGGFLAVCLLFAVIVLVAWNAAQRAQWRNQALSMSELVDVAGGLIMVCPPQNGRIICAATQPNAVPIQVESFAIEKHEVSNAQYELCRRANGCLVNPVSEWYGRETHRFFSVQGINALQATEYCQWIGRQLPTELQWEVALGESDLPFADFHDLSPVDVPIHQTTSGIVNLLGNVSEWTRSYAQENTVTYQEALWDGNDNTLSHQSFLVIRGDSWLDSTTRIEANGRQLDMTLGFRCLAHD